MWEYTQSVDPEAEEPCPYDSSHMIRRKRMQYHLMKCRKNHPGKDFATCPFNACHEMPRPELRYHIATCPDKHIIEKDLAYEQEKEIGEGNMFKGCTDVPAYNSYEVSCSESWDEETNPHPRIGVDKTFLDKVKFKNITGMTPAQKRHFHRTLNPEHNPPEAPVQSMSNRPDKENQQPKGQGDGKLRLPKNAPKAYSMYQEEPLARPQQTPSTVFAYSLAQCGIGRGRGVCGSLGRGISTTQPAPPRPGTMTTRPQPPQGTTQPGPPHPSTAFTQPNPVRPASVPFQPGPLHPAHVADTNPAYQQQAAARVTSGYNSIPNMTDHPYEAIPPSTSRVSQSQTRPPQAAPPSHMRNVQAPLGIFPDQIRSKPVGRGRGSQPAPIDPWPILNGSINTNCNQYTELVKNGSVFSPSVGTALMQGSNPSFVVPKLQTECPNLKALSSDLLDSEGSSSGSENLRDVHGIEGAKKRKQLQKKLRQIELLEAKQETGTPLNTEEEVKLCKKDEILEQLQALTI